MDLYYKTSSLRISTTSPLTEDEFNFNWKWIILQSKYYKSMSPCTRQPTLKILMSVILPPFMLQLCPIVQLSCLVFTTLPNVKLVQKTKIAAVTDLLFQDKLQDGYQQMRNKKRKWDTNTTMTKGLLTTAVYITFSRETLTRSRWLHIMMISTSDQEKPAQSIGC